MPNLYIIAGCNGAGKTTASYTILPEMLDCREFVNADEIAKGLSPFQPETVSFQAGRIMLERINDLLAAKVDFAFETTLSTKSYIHTLRKAQESGYEVTLLYFWLNSPALAIERVKQQVASGGHHIPEDVIKRRYQKGLSNLLNLFIPAVNYWTIVDNSHEPYKIIAEGDSKETKVYNEKIWNVINDTRRI